MNSIDVDAGGTFTDMVLRVDEQVIIKKSPTTPYDLSTCFINVIETGAEELGVDLDELLPEIDVVRYSTTVALNRLIERKGPRLGLITTEGHEDVILIGKGAQWVDGKTVTERRNLAIQRKPEPLISRDCTIGAKERLDNFGNVVRPLVEDDIRRKIHYLVSKGVRGFVVSLLWSHVNPIHERRIREIIREEYKEFYLGSLPIVLSHEVIARTGEYQRTMTAILDAYLVRSMQLELSAMWDRLRDYGYRGPFMMVHNSGGMADVFKTDPVRTYSAGPVAGLIGSHHYATQLGYKNVVATDVGGTSFDIGVVAEQSVRNYEFRPVIDTWMVGLSMLQTLSIGAGGGSIAWINKALDRLEIGPQSAGAYPGPVCYDQGGEDPTVTDADLVLGYINPDYYYGGKMALNKAKAEQAIKERIADPLNVSPLQAAWLIKKLADGMMGAAIRKEIQLRGYDPEEFTLFAYGGNGPTHVAGYMGDINSAFVFPESPVFSALGSSMMDIKHIYEASHRFELMAPVTQKMTEKYQEFNEAVNSLLDKAKKELVAEGLPIDDAIFSLELDMLYGGQVHRKRSSCPMLSISSPDHIKEIYNVFEKEFSEAFSPLVVHPKGGVYVETFVITASIPAEPLKLSIHELSGLDPVKAKMGERAAYWGNDELELTKVFDFTRLEAGNVVTGPAIAESEYTTVVVPPGFTLEMDKHKFAYLKRNSVQ